MKIIRHTKASLTNLDNVTRDHHRVFLFGFQIAGWRTKHKSRPSDWMRRQVRLAPLLLCVFALNVSTSRAGLFSFFGNLPTVKASSSTNSPLVQVGTFTFNGATLFLSNGGTAIPTNLTAIPMLTFDATGTNFWLFAQQVHPSQSIATNNEGFVITNFTVPVYGALRLINTTNVDQTAGASANIN